MVRTRTTVSHCGSTKTTVRWIFPVPVLKAMLGQNICKNVDYDMPARNTDNQKLSSDSVTCFKILPSLKKNLTHLKNLTKSNDGFKCYLAIRHVARS